MPRVSVVTPTYNRANVLPRAMRSVREQTFGDYEHIIIDDGSTDETQAVVADHGNERTEYVRLDPNRGAAAALNKGISVADGEYVSFLDSDDEYKPERLAVTSKVLASQPESVGGVFHGFERIDDVAVPDHSVPAGVLTQTDLAARNVIRGTSNTIYRSNVLDHVGRFDEALPSSVDYDFQLRVLKEFDLFGIDELLSRKHDSVKGIQDDPELIYEGLKQVIEKHREVLTDGNLAERHLDIGRASLRLGEEAEARRRFERALDLCPPANRIDVHYKAASAYLVTDRRETARRHLARCIRKDPLNYKFHSMLAASFLPIDGQRLLEVLIRAHDTLRGWLAK